MTKYQHLSDEEWLEIIRNCVKSGICIKKWCLENGLNRHTYRNRRIALLEKGLATKEELFVQPESNDVVPLEIFADPDPEEDESQVENKSQEEDESTSMTIYRAEEPARTDKSGESLCGRPEGLLALPTVRVSMNGITVEFTNGAYSRIIADVLREVRRI